MVQTINSVSDRLQDVSSMSSVQSSAVQQLVRMIQGLQLDFQGMRHNLQEVKGCTSLKRGSSSFAPSRDNAVDSNGLYQSISRLCNLAAIKDGELFSAEAQLVSREMEEIFASLLGDTVSATGILW